MKHLIIACNGTETVKFLYKLDSRRKSQPTHATTVFLHWLLRWIQWIIILILILIHCSAELSDGHFGTNAKRHCRRSSPAGMVN